MKFNQQRIGDGNKLDKSQVLPPMKAVEKSILKNGRNSHELEEISVNSSSV